MKALTPKSPSPRRLHPGGAAFSLIEMMVAVALLGVVMFAMYSLFNQTQRALRQAVGQVDVNEPARAALDLISDNLRQAAQVNVPEVENFMVRYFTDENAPLPTRTPAWSEKVGPRSQAHHEVYFLKQIQDRAWTSAGFFVGQESSAVAGYRADRPWPPPVGTLYFYSETTNILARGDNIRVPSGTANQFRSLLLKNFNNLDYRTAVSSRVLDGVVVFRVLAYDAYGRLMDEYSLSQLMKLPLTNGVYKPDIRFFANTQVELPGKVQTIKAPATFVTFLNEEIPSSLEIELGIMEPKTLDKYRAAADGGAPSALAFLERNQGSIQMYRRRVDLRTAPRPYLP